MVKKGNHPQMALIQVGELLQFTQILSSSIFQLIFSQVPSETSADFWRLQAERRQRAAAKQMEILTDSGIPLGSPWGWHGMTND